MSLLLAKEEDLKTGTTTVGIITKDAVVLAADMKATMGHLSYDLEAKKLYKITTHTALTNAGMVGDSLTIIRFLRARAKLYETERNSKMTTKAMASFLSNVLNANRLFPFAVQFIIGGNYGKPSLFELTPYGGVLERKKYATSGSGTTLALATLDQQYKEGMTKEEGIKLAVKSISSAKKRDIYSGGRSISVMTIDQTGAREIPEEKIKKYIEAESKLN